MEYRLKYRDIPWIVAFGVLPGKIIGTLFIKPFIKLRRNRGHLARVWLARFCTVLLALVVGAVIFVVADHFSDGAVIASLDRTWDWWVSAALTANEIAPAPTEIGLR
jgi:hypothetical protein